MAGPTLHRRRLLGLVGAAGVGSLAGCTSSVVGSWPMYGHDARNSGASEEASGPSEPFSVAWDQSFGPLGRPDSTSRAVVGGGLVLVGHVYQVSSKNNDGAIAALNGDGEVEWSIRTDDGQTRAPIVGGDQFFHHRGNHTVVGRSLDGGDVVWTYDTDRVIKSPMRISGDVLLAGTADGHVVAIDAAEGERRWQFELDGQYAAAPLVAADGTMVSTTEDAIVCFDPTADAVHWQRPDPGSSIGYVLASGLLLYSDDRGDEPAIRAIDVDEDEERWAVPAPNGRARRFSVTDGTLLGPVSPGGTGRESSVVAYDLADGRRLWETSLSGGRVSRVAATASTAYGTALDGRLHAIDVDSGDRTATIDTGFDGALVDTIVAGERVYVSWRNGHVVAIE